MISHSMVKNITLKDIKDTLITVLHTFYEPCVFGNMEKDKIPDKARLSMWLLDCIAHQHGYFGDLDYYWDDFCNVIFTQFMNEKSKRKLVNKLISAENSVLKANYALGKYDTIVRI